jgi:hypothetical protein
MRRSFLISSVVLNVVAEETLGEWPPPTSHIIYGTRRWQGTSLTAWSEPLHGSIPQRVFYYFRWERFSLKRVQRQEYAGFAMSPTRTRRIQQWAHLFAILVGKS